MWNSEVSKISPPIGSSQRRGGARGRRRPAGYHTVGVGGPVDYRDASEVAIRRCGVTLLVWEADQIRCRPGRDTGAASETAAANKGESVAGVLG